MDSILQNFILYNDSSVSYARFPHGDVSGKTWNDGAVNQANKCPSASVDTFEQPPSQNQGYRNTRGK